jgi:hypothetical protein
MSTEILTGNTRASLGPKVDAGDSDAGGPEIFVQDCLPGNIQKGFI